MEKNLPSLQSPLNDVEKRMDCLEEKINSAPLSVTVSESAHLQNQQHTQPGSYDEHH